MLQRPLEFPDLSRRVRPNLFLSLPSFLNLPDLPAPHFMLFQQPRSNNNQEKKSAQRTRSLLHRKSSRRRRNEKREWTHRLAQPPTSSTHAQPRFLFSTSTRKLLLWNVCPEQPLPVLLSSFLLVRIIGKPNSHSTRPRKELHAKGVPSAVRE